MDASGRAEHYSSVEAQPLLVNSMRQHNAELSMVRLVKGAYWDTEVKRAQERGLDDYPVFTRKAMTALARF